MTSPGVGSAQLADLPKKPEGAVVPKESLRKYWRYGLIAALVVLCAGAFVAYKKRNMYVFSVMAKVYLAPRFATVLSEQKETELDSYQKLHQFQEQQALMVKSYEVALEALKTLNMHRKKNFLWLDPKFGEYIAVDETPLINEVKELTKQWKNQIRLDYEKRLETMKENAGKIGNPSNEFDEIMQEIKDDDDLEQAQLERQEPPELRAALKRLEEAQDKNEEGLRSAAERLADTIQVTVVKDSYLMNVGMDYTMDKNKPMPLDKIVNTIVKVYIEKSKSESFFTQKDARIALLDARREQLVKKINYRMAQRTAVAQDLGVTTFSENTVNPFDQVLLDSKAALEIAERNLIAAKSAKAVFEDDQGRVNREALDAASFEQVSVDPTLNTLKGNVNLRRTKLLEMLSGLQESHPLKKNIERELKEVDEELNRGTEEVTRRVGNVLILQRKSDVIKAQGIVDGISRQIAKNQAEAKRFSEKYNLALGYNNEIRRFQNQLEEVELRKDKLMIEFHAPSMARMDSKALKPTKGKGGGKKIAVIASVASIIIGLIVPVLIDFIKFKLSGQIRTTNQLYNLLGYTPLAGLYEPSENLNRRRVMADIKRRLAVALEREHQLQDTRIFLLTSIKPEAGVTNLAFDLSLEFGDLGVKSLVLEVNALKSDPRYHADQFQTGLIDLINGDGTVEEAISQADGLLPDRISVGYPANPHLYGYEKLREIIDFLKTLYPVIFLDAPPVLFSADAEFLCAIADHTLLLVKAHDVTKGELTRAVSILEKLELKAISFIVTNLEVYAKGGYYTEKGKEYNAYNEKAKLNLWSRFISKQDAIPRMKPIFLYALHSGNLYGTERMALYTLDGLRDVFMPVLLTPPGPALVEAEKMGIRAVPFLSLKDLIFQLRHLMSENKQIAFAATGVAHSLLFSFWNFFYRRHAVHLHLVHGGTDERESYGRKKMLNGKNVTFVAVSNFVRERLIANHVNPDQIVVVGNFLPDSRILSAPRHPPFVENGIRKVIVVSRVDPIKRIDLLMDALDRHPDLRDLPIRVFGTGWDFDLLRNRALENHPNVVFEGFCAEVENELAASDLLLHLCPVEPFGLAILEAMAAGIPVLVPDQGGAGGLVEADVTGFHFRADDADDLAAALARLRQTPAEALNLIVSAATDRLQTHYSSSACLENYKNLFAELLDV